MFLSFKYDPIVLRSVLFPGQQSSRKRPRTDDADDQTMAVDTDAEAEAQLSWLENEERSRRVVLETAKERYLISPSPLKVEDDTKNINLARRYTVSRIVERDPELVNKDEGQPPTISKPPIDTKLPPPTWSIPPTESSSTHNKDQSPTEMKLPMPTTTDIAKQMRAKPSTKVLSNDREQAHFRFSVNGLTIEGLDWGVDDVIVKRWRWALPEEFATN